jgi:DNA polymerase-3 subunit delta
LRAEQFTAHLTGAGSQLAPLYAITGDEPLLVLEAADALRSAARAAGFTERRSLVMDARSDWSTLSGSMQSISLFGDRELLELRLPTGKPGKAGGDAIVKMAQQAADTPNPDALTALVLPRLDKTARAAAWFLALTRHAVVVEVPNIDRAALPRWVGERLARQNQRTDPDTLQWIADRVEGNLLAAHQEIQKLGLILPTGTLDPEQVRDAIMNVARYDAFKLREAMLAGDAVRVVRMIDGLRAEGEALPLVLWAVGEEIRLLARLADARRDGQNLSALMRTMRMFGDHERQALAVLDRVPAHTWPAAVRHAHEADRLIKGLSVSGRLADPWHELTRLALRLAVRPRAPRAARPTPASS